jgi:hypothetical protein
MTRASFLLLALGVAGPTPPQALPTLTREDRPPVVLPGTPSPLGSWIGDSILALADVEEQRVMLVEVRSGRVRWAGRPGDGPGEYRGVTAPVPGPDGTLLVLDTRLRRATILGPALDLRRTIAIPVVVSSVLQWTGSGLLCTWYDFSRQMSPYLGLLRFTDQERAEPEPLVRLDSLFGVATREPFSLPPIVASAAGARGRTYVGRLDQYRILRLDPSGRPTMTFARPEVPVHRFSAREIEEQTGKLRAATTTPVPAAAASRVKDMLSGTAKPFFALTGLSEDPEGRLWVVTARGDTHHTEVDVFASSGRFLGTLRLRGHVRSLAWKGNRVAAVVDREEGEEKLGAVDFYRIR